MRPLIAIPARFSATTSALRYAAEINARALVEAVWRSGGEPASVHPAEGSGTAAGLARFEGVLLPGGGDLAPYRYGADDAHDTVYDVDDLQDTFDLHVARCALKLGLPLFAVCRGLQVVNVALGGTLEQDMGARSASTGTSSTGSPWSRIRSSRGPRASRRPTRPVTTTSASTAPGRVWR